MSRMRAHLIVALLAMMASWNYIPAQLCLTVTSPESLVALRFGLAAIAIFLLFPRVTLALRWHTFRPGLIVGLLFGSALIPLYVSLRTTHSGVTAFLVGTCAVFVPLLEYAVMRRVPTRAQIAGLVLAMGGSAAMTIKGDLTLDVGSAWGLLSALLFAFWAVGLSHFRRSLSGLELGLGQVYGTAILFSTITFFTSGIPFAAFTPSMWLGILYLGVIGGALRFLLQSHVQGYTTATAVEIIFLLEPLFAFIWAGVFNHEVASARQTAGSLLVLLGVLVAQLPARQGPGAVS